MNYYVSNLEVSPYIQHFGILGMHWGVRRYQNADGSLTAAGKKRYAAEKKVTDKIKKTHNSQPVNKVGNYLINGFSAPTYSAYRSQGKSMIAAWAMTGLKSTLMTTAAASTISLGAAAITKMTGTSFIPNARGKMVGSLALSAGVGALMYHNTKKKMIDEEMKKSK